MSINCRSKHFGIQLTSSKRSHMTWEELETKHAAQWTELNASRDKEYRELIERHEELEYAFKDLGEQVPLNIKERMRNDYNDWSAKWQHSGEHMNDLRKKQNKEMRDWVKVEKFKDKLNDMNLRDSRRDKDYDR